MQYQRVMVCLKFVLIWWETWNVVYKPRYSWCKYLLLVSIIPKSMVHYVMEQIPINPENNLSIVGQNSWSQCILASFRYWDKETKFTPPT